MRICCIFAVLLVTWQTAFALEDFRWAFLVKDSPNTANTVVAYVDLSNIKRFPRELTPPFSRVVAFFTLLDYPNSVDDVGGRSEIRAYKFDCTVDMLQLVQQRRFSQRMGNGTPILIAQDDKPGKWGRPGDALMKKMFDYACKD